MKEYDLWSSITLFRCPVCGVLNDVCREDKTYGVCPKCVKLVAREFVDLCAVFSQFGYVPEPSWAADLAAERWRMDKEKRGADQGGKDRSVL